MKKKLSKKQEVTKPDIVIIDGKTPEAKQPEAKTKLTFAWKGDKFPLDYESIHTFSESKLKSDRERIDFVKMALQADWQNRHSKVQSTLDVDKMFDFIYGRIPPASLEESLTRYLKLLEERVETASSGKITWKSELSNLIYLLMKLQSHGFVDTELSIPAIIENHFQDAGLLPFRNVKQQLQRIRDFEKSKDSGTLDAIIASLPEANSE